MTLRLTTILWLCCRSRCCRSCRTVNFTWNVLILCTALSTSDIETFGICHVLDTSNCLIIKLPMLSGGFLANANYFTSNSEGSLFTSLVWKYSHGLVLEDMLTRTFLITYKHATTWSWIINNLCSSNSLSCYPLYFLTFFIILSLYLHLCISLFLCYFLSLSTLNVKTRT